MKLKTLGWVVVAVVVAVLIGIVALLMNLNRIVRSGVETASTASLGLRTTLDAAHVSLLGGAVDLSRFQVASPPGFASPHFLDISRIGLQVSYGELRNNPIRVGTLELQQPRLVLEQKDGKFNLKAVFDTLPPSDPAAQPPNLIISTIRVTSPQVVIKPGIPGLSQELNLTLPDVTLTEIGTGPEAENGVAIRKAVLLVAADLARSAANSDKLPPELRLLLQTDLGNLRQRLGETARQMADQARQQLENAGGNVRDAAGRAVEDAQRAVEEGVGGLLNRNRRP